MHSIKLRSIALGLLASFVFFGASLNNVKATGGGWQQTYCTHYHSIFCDNFSFTTWFKDQTPYAQWYRYSFNPALYSNYINTNGNLKLFLDSTVAGGSYSNVNISTSEINNQNGNFLFGENTRVDVRMKYSPNTKADSTGTAKGSSGLLFWNYFLTDAIPETGQIEAVNDAFGFVWQDAESFPNAGFWIAAVADGMPGEYKPMFNVDLSQWHTYSIERRHESIKYFIDGTKVHEVPLNQPGTIQLSANDKLSVDMWYDNASYVVDFNTFEINLNFKDITENQYIKIDYVRVKAI